jgi:hypothetical protein
MKKELSDKVETIGKPIDEKNQLSQGCTVDSGAVQIAVQQVKEQPIWHDADKVFPDYVSTKVKTGNWRPQDVYLMNWEDVDPLAITKNLTCRIEKMMGIFPNIGHLNSESDE